MVRLDGPAAEILWLLLGLTLVRGVIYALLNPPFGSPDERDHFQYVAHLATAGASGPRGAEGHQPVPYYALMVPAYWLTAGQSVAVQNLAIRLASLPFLLGAVLFTWLAARKMAPNSAFVPVVAAALVALHPQLAYIGASANNDNAANLMGAVLTYLVVSLLAGPAPWTAPATALALGAAFVTKGQILPVVAVSALVLVGFTFGHSSATRPRGFLLCLVAGAAVVFLALGTDEGGTLVTRSQESLSLLMQPPQVVEVAGNAGAEPLPYLFLSFWAAFVGESVHPSTFWYAVAAAAVAGGLVAHAVHAARQRTSGQAVAGRAVLVPAVLLSLIVAQGLAVYLRYLFAYQDPNGPWRLQVLQGRFLLAALVPLALLVAQGWNLPPGPRERTLGAVGIVGALAALDMASLMSLAGYHGWPAGR